MPNSRRNRAEVPGARNALDHLKSEVATELGVPNYDQIDKGALPSRLNGKVGGVMVRKMIEFAEEAMKSSPQALQAVEQQPGATEEDRQVAQQSLAAANAFMAQFDAGQAVQAGMPLQNGQAGQAGMPLQDGQAGQAAMPFPNGQAAQTGMPLQNGQAAQAGMPLQNGQAAQAGMPFPNGQAIQDRQAAQQSPFLH